MNIENSVQIQGENQEYILWPVPHHVALVGSQEAGGVVQLPPLSAQLKTNLCSLILQTQWFCKLFLKVGV